MASSEVILLTGSSNRKVEVTVGAGESRQLVFVALPGASGTIDCSVSVRFAGEGGDCSLRGLYLAGGEASVRFEVDMEHCVPGCRSRQLFKGIIGGQARTRFFGLIRVPGQCSGTEAYQENHNLLLGDDCRAQSLPQLEIYADDVKCSHGATFGRIDEEGLFYLRSRGIPLDRARKLQMTAFASEVLEGLPEEIVSEALESLDSLI